VAWCLVKDRDNLNFTFFYVFCHKLYEMNMGFNLLSKNEWNITLTLCLCLHGMGKLLIYFLKQTLMEHLNV
jgi:hypothetical protein